MYIYIYVCVYTYIYIYVYTHIYMYTRTHLVCLFLLAYGIEKQGFVVCSRTNLYSEFGDFSNKIVFVWQIVLSVNFVLGVWQ